MVRYPAVIFAILNVLFLAICYHFIFWQQSSGIEIKLRAVERAQQAQAIIGARLIGEEYTPITTTLGAKDAKQMSLHPDFAAVAVALLQEAGVQAGDKVAVNMSGSFPALNIAVLAAIESIGSTPIITSSVGASSWGANRPEFTWLDMENALAAAGAGLWRSCAVSMGGGSDQGAGLPPEGIALIHSAIERSGITPLPSDTLQAAIEGRLQLYQAQNQGVLPKVLVNIGGSHVFFGEQGHNMLLRQGLTRGYHPHIAAADGLAAAFLMNNRGVIHFINIKRLAAYYHIKPGETGQSKVFHSLRIPLWLRVMIIFWLAGGGMWLWYGRRQKYWKC